MDDSFAQVLDARSPSNVSEMATKQQSGGRGMQTLKCYVVLRVIKAELLRSFDLFGKMDPFAVVRWGGNDGLLEIGKTRVDWQGHLTPQWDHTCRIQLYSQGDRVEIQVWEKDLVGSGDLCGTTILLPVDDILAEGSIEEFRLSLSQMLAGPDVNSMMLRGPIKELALTKDGETTGRVMIQATITTTSYDKTHSGIVPKPVAVDMFESPVTPLGVSGGTAAFYNLKLCNPLPGQSPAHYIGKDLSRAEDEVDFYEQAKRLLSRRSGLNEILSFTFEYAGILSAKVKDAPADAKNVDLLVMRNLRDGRAKLRMLDLKIGQQTAHGGWQGKGRLGALKQSVLDGLTNSSCEGYRLEGFDNEPPNVDAMDPLLDFQMLAKLRGDGGKEPSAKEKSKLAKKAKRIMLQRLTGADIFMHFTDVHHEPADPGSAELKEVLAPTELIEIVLHETVQRLIGISIACRHTTVPQKWIGSSVALGFDCGQLPSRAQPLEETRNAVVVNIFDWGRSELNTIQKHHALSDQEQHDRAKFWKYYVGGIDRLTWEATRAYYHRFSTRRWGTIYLNVVDFDSTQSNDFIGRIILSPVREKAECTERLVDCSGGSHMNKLCHCGFQKKPTLTYRVEHRTFPEGSRLRSSWRIHIVRASSLPHVDRSQLKGSCDPFVEVVAISDDERFCHRQQVSVKVLTSEPVWNETIVIPEVDNTDMLDAALKTVIPDIDSAQLGSILPPDAGPKAASGDGVFMEWKQCLDRWATLKKATSLDRWPTLKQEERVPEPSLDALVAPELLENSLAPLSALQGQMGAQTLMSAIENHVEYETVGVCDNELVEISRGEAKKGETKCSFLGWVCA